jgi:DNA-binding transcriptional LysR family regulator
LLSHDWIVGSEQSALFTHLQMRALAAGSRIQARISYPGVDGMLRFVARGLGVTVLPRMILAGHFFDSALAAIPLEEPWAQRQLLACYLSEASGQRRDLADAIASK